LSHYEINVSKNGTHFFATHERSIKDRTSLIAVHEKLSAAFTPEDGFELKITFWALQGTTIYIEDAGKDGFNPYDWL